jgi:hypothetical protein
MIEDDHAPPAVVRKAQSLKERANKIRAMYAQHVRMTAVQAADIGKELLALKEQCIEEGDQDFTASVKDAGMQPRSAERYMQLARNWPLLESHFRHESFPGVANCLTWLAEHYCRLCKLNGPKKGCKECARLRRGEDREPGVDEKEDYEQQIERANTFWRARLKALGNLKVSTNGTVDQAFRHLEGLLTAYKQLCEAPLKPADPPRQAKCRDCQADILWAGPNEKGKNVPLQPEPGGGSFRLVENRPVYVKRSHDLDTSELYRVHECPARKKT